MTDELIPTQEDREAAIASGVSLLDLMIPEMRDRHPLVQAFARHAAPLRAEIERLKGQMPADVAGLVERLNEGVLIIGEGLGQQPLIDVVTANQAMRKAASALTAAVNECERLRAAGDAMAEALDEAQDQLWHLAKDKSENYLVKGCNFALAQWRAAQGGGFHEKG